MLLLLPERVLLLLLLHLYSPLYCQEQHSTIFSCSFSFPYTARGGGETPLSSPAQVWSFKLQKKTLGLLLLHLSTLLKCQGEHTSFFFCSFVLLYTATENTPPSYPGHLYSSILRERTLLLLPLHLYTPLYCQGEYVSFFSCSFMLLYNARESTPHSLPASMFFYTPLYSQEEHFSLFSCNFIPLYTAMKNTPPPSPAPLYLFYHWAKKKRLEFFLLFTKWGHCNNANNKNTRFSFVDWTNDKPKLFKENPIYLSWIP